MTTLLDTMPLAQQTDIDDFSRALLVADKYLGRWAVGDSTGGDAVDDRHMSVEAGVWPIMVRKARKVVLLSKPPEVRVAHTISMYPSRRPLRIASMARVSVKVVEAAMVVEKYGLGDFLREGLLTIGDAMRMIRNRTHKSLQAGRLSVEHAISPPAGTSFIRASDHKAFGLGEPIASFNVRHRCSECDTGMVPGEPQCVSCGHESPRGASADVQVHTVRLAPRRCSRCGTGLLRASDYREMTCLTCGDVQYIEQTTLLRHEAA